jgi:PKD repeat protein
VGVTHGYQIAGNYSVTLTVIDDGGLMGQAMRLIQIEEPAPINQPPTAVISGPVGGLVGEALSFDASASGDSDGSIVSYDWDLGDGNTASGVSVTHSYVLSGSYHVSLTVTDDDGMTDQATHAVQIDDPAPVNQPPMAVISGPVTGLGARRSASMPAHPATAMAVLWTTIGTSGMVVLLTR